MQAPYEPSNGAKPRRSLPPVDVHASLTKRLRKLPASSPVGTVERITPARAKLGIHLGAPGIKGGTGVRVRICL